MPPVPNKANMDDSESQFDFLNVDDNQSGSNPAGQGERDDPAGRSPESVSRSGRAAAVDKPFPVIRKPVCVTQTGALRPPQPGAPVEPPPPLTDGVRVAPTPVKRPERAEIDFSDLDDLGLDNDDWPASDQWVDRTERTLPRQYEEPETSLLRKCGYGLAGLLIVTGAVTALYSVPSVKSWTDETISGLFGTLPDSANVSNTEIAQDVNTPPAIDVNAPKSLNTLFREELSTLETLLAQGSLDEVEQRMQTMDRAVYGYGAPEFTEIKEQLAVLKQGGTLDPESSNTQLAEQQRATDALVLEKQLAEEQLLEEQRAAAELERQASAEREAAQAAEALAAEQQRAAAQAEALALQKAQQEEEAAEAQRVALQQAEQEKAAADAERIAAQRAEEQRLAAAAQEEARLVEAQQRAERERQAAAQAQIQADRIAQEKARQEQLEIATQERTVLEQRLSQQRSAAQEAASAAYQSEEGQGSTPQGQQESIQDLAASQREAARQQRLVDARERSALEQSTASAAQSEPDNVVALAEPSVSEPVQEPVPKNISDSDLQFVYGQFAQLQAAIEDRNVNAVIRLTERSGIRIQQVMQMFENNVSIQARLRNVSTLDATGEIQGTLQITRLVRADGSVTGPPLNLGSVRLSSVRKGDGWSSIRW